MLARRQSFPTATAKGGSEEGILWRQEGLLAGCKRRGDTLKLMRD
jgi:hypothetical protein